MKAYVALKLAGLPADDARMVRLRARILELGGIQAANSYVKVNLSLFDLYPRQYCPSIPPEVVLLPWNFLYQMSSWTRAIVVSLSIVHSANPRRPVPAVFTLDELWLPGVDPAFHKDPSTFTWHNFFLLTDRLLKWWERGGSKALRRKAVARAKEWMIERLRHSDGLGAIYPPMMYSVMALDVLGFAADDPAARRSSPPVRSPDGGRRRAVLFPALLLAGLGYRDRRAMRWRRAMAAIRRSRAAADWLLAREVRRKGDWAVKRPDTEPSAGPSNTATSSIRTSTTPRWCCSR